MPEQKSALTRRALLLGATAGLGALVGRECRPTNDPGPRYPATSAPNVLDDASQLSPTPVASHLTIKETPAASIEKIRSALAEAREARRPFIASAARHSMGGQSLARDGTVVTLDQAWLEADPAQK